MSNVLPKKIVTKNILLGIKKAERDYRVWSGDDWLWRAPEYLLTVYVSKQLSKLDYNKYITLENSTKETISDAGATGKGKLHSAIRVNGRVDILLWWANGLPRAVIEIKNGVYGYKKIEKDVSRICQMLNRKSKDSSLQFGVISFYMARHYEKENPEDMMKKQIKRLLQRSRADSLNLCKVEVEHTDIVVEYKQNSWCCVNLIFTPIKKQT